MAIYVEKSDSEDIITPKWKMLSNSNRSVKFQIFFENPLEISNDDEKPDVLVVNITDTQIFYSDKINQYLEPTSLRMRRTLRKQFPNSNLNNSILTSAKVASGGMLMILIVSFVLNMVIRGALEYLILLIRSL
jgi:hypothetical protein